MKAAPCKDCHPPKRWANEKGTCHAECTEYLSWRERLDVENSRIRDQKHYENVCTENMGLGY